MSQPADESLPGAPADESLPGAPADEPSSAGSALSWESAVPATLLLALFAWTFTLHSPKPGYDLYWFLHLGRTMAQTGSIPHTDSFLNTAPFLQPHYWLNDEWGFEVAVYWIWSVLGYAGLALGKSLLICGTFACMFASCRRVGMGTLPACAWLVVVAWMMEPRFTPRPHLVTDLCLAVLVWTLLRWERKCGPHVAFVLPLFVLWANVHAGVTTGLGVLGLWLLGEAMAVRFTRDAWMLRRVALALALAGVGTLLSPQGSGMWRHLVEHATSPAMGMIDEWAPVGADWWKTGYGLFVEVSAVAFLGAYAARRASTGLEGPLRLSHVLVTVALAALAARYNRVINELGAVSAPLVAASFVQAATLPALDRALGDARARVGARGLLAIALLGVAVPVLARFPPPSSAYEPDKHILPVEAVRFMQRHPLPGRLYNTYHYGGFLLWCQVPPFIHGCPPLYGDELLQDYLALAIGNDVTQSFLLQKYDIRTCLLDYQRYPRIFTGLIFKLSRDPAWKLVYWDDGAVLFTRADAGVAVPEAYTAVNPGLPDPFVSLDEIRIRAELARRLREDPECLEARRLQSDLEKRLRNRMLRQ